MKNIELTLPDETFSLADSYIAQKARPDSFAAVYHNTLQYLWDTNTLLAKPLTTIDSDTELGKYACIRWNDVANHDFLPALSRTLQEYVIDHDGVIDSWPIPDSEQYNFYQSAPGLQFHFDFFGEDYDCKFVNGLLTSVRKSDGYRLYLLPPEPRNTVEFDRMERDLARLRSVKDQKWKAYMDIDVPTVSGIAGNTIAAFFNVVYSIVALAAIFFGIVFPIPAILSFSRNMSGQILSFGDSLSGILHTLYKLCIYPVSLRLDAKAMAGLPLLPS